MRLLQKEVLENQKGETTQSFRYAQRRKRGRRKRYIRKAHSTLRRFRRFAPRSLKAIGFLQQYRNSIFKGDNCSFQAYNEI